jgi:hypothetical protein
MPEKLQESAEPELGPTALTSRVCLTASHPAVTLELGPVASRI